MKHILLRTPGIDSTIARYYLERELGIDNLTQVYVNLHHRYAKKEIEALKRLSEIEGKPIQFLEAFPITEFEDAFIPARNVLLTTIAANFAGEDCVIYIGGLADDNVVDNSPVFCEDMSDILTHYCEKYKVKVMSPFQYRLSKAEIVRWFVDNIPNAKQILLNTLSCYDDSSEGHCFRCPACLRRNVVLFQVGIVLPFYNKRLLEIYKTKMEDPTTPYTRERRKATLKYIDYILNNGGK